MQTLSLIQRAANDPNEVTRLARLHCALADPVTALVPAGREATVNAAKWSGTSNISLYIEAEPSEVSMFIRDQGHGFDPDQVPSDRQGIRRSIHERMTRHGGSAVIRSSLDTGTEVELRLPVPSRAR